MTQPTPRDLENARKRQEIADRQRAEYEEVQSLALATLGPGWHPWMKILLLDADHRRTGNTTPIAIVYKVRRSEQSLYLRRMPDGRIETADSYEPLFGALLDEKHPTRTVEVRGQLLPVGRYEVIWSALELYEPRTAEQLAAAREKRQERAVERAAQDNPLFADQIRTGQLKPTKKRRGRGSD